jgi:hypothetical protein
MTGDSKSTVTRSCRSVQELGGRNEGHGALNHNPARAEPGGGC